MRKILLLVALLLSVVMPCSFAEQATVFEKGDYIEFGSYQDQPLLWQVIHVDIDGNPLLQTKKVISIKGFDAAESGSFRYRQDPLSGLYLGPDIPNSTVEGQTGSVGSSRWTTSNLRDWLNSSEEVVTYTSAPPTDQGMLHDYNHGANAYDKEAGFLSNFTDYEQSLIKTTRNKTILTISNRFERIGGNKVFKVEPQFDKNDNMRIIYDMAEYDESFYELSYDKVFVLSLDQFFEYVIGINYYEERKDEAFINNEAWAKYPTAEAVEADETFHSLNEVSNYWLRTPEDETSVYRSIGDTQANLNGLTCSYLGSTLACTSFAGVAPALYLEHSELTTYTGNGDIHSPYTFSKEVK